MRNAFAFRTALAAALVSCLLAAQVRAQSPDAGLGDAARPDGATSPTTDADHARATDAQGTDSVAPRRATLKGEVVSQGIREPLSGASVLVDGIQSLETGLTGRFEVALPVGRHRLQIQFPGFEPLDTSIELTGPGVIDRLYRLAPRQTGERYESVVTAPADQGARLPLRREELTRTPGSMGEPFRVIESLPGVAQPVWPLALYTIRGANPGNTGFFVDGVRLPALFHLALGPSVIHPFFLEQIDFYPGGYPARYGRYTSGLVAARTQTPQVDRVRGAVDVRLFDAGAIVATPINGGKGSVAVAGRYSYTGFLISALSDTYTLDYWDYQLRAEHRLGPGKLVLFAFGSGDSLGHKLQNDTHARITFHRVDLKWEGAALGGRLEAAILGGVDHTGTQLKPIINLPIASSTRTLAPRLFFVRQLGKKLQLETGADAEWQAFQPEAARFDAGRLDVFQDRTVLQTGGFVGVAYRPHERLVIAPAWRQELFIQQGTTQTEPSPRLTLRTRLFGDVWLKAIGGRFVQMASFPVPVPGFEGFGLRDPGLQTSVQGSLGVEAAIPGDLYVEATAFYQRFRLTDLKTQFEVDPQEGVLEMRDGRGFGVELMVRRALTHRLHGWVAYTISKSERLNPKSYVRFPSDWDQRHILNVVMQYRLPRNWSVGGKFHLNTGRPYPLFDERNQTPPEYIRLPTFYRIDARIDRRFVFDSFVLDAYFEMINATLTREIFDVKRRSDGTLDEVSFPIVLPSLGIHAEW